jgi:putative ABC transport system substrate-binding protein
MNPKLFWLITAILFVSTRPAAAQQPAKIPRIGYLIIAPLPQDRSEAFRRGLRELGYVEGKNIVIDWRSANGKWERGPSLARDRLNSS